MGDRPPRPIGRPKHIGAPTRLTILNDPSRVRVAEGLGVLEDLLDIYRLNEVCECGWVPDSLECRNAGDHKKRKRAKPAPPQPWEGQTAAHSPARTGLPERRAA